jgi:hypothetical protein
MRFLTSGFFRQTIPLGPLIHGAGGGGGAKAVL